jgi:parvulin-like peptidyl-prolyl isomerase
MARRTLDEIRAMYPSTVELPPMTDAICERILDDIYTKMLQWRKGSGNISSQQTNLLMESTDELIGLGRHKMIFKLRQDRSGKIMPVEYATRQAAQRARRHFQERFKISFSVVHVESEETAT